MTTALSSSFRTVLAIAPHTRLDHDETLNVALKLLPAEFTQLSALLATKDVARDKDRWFALSEQYVQLEEALSRSA